MTPDLLFVLEHHGHRAIQLWCRKAFNGCADGNDLACSAPLDTADRILTVLEEAGWIRRVKYRPGPSFTPVMSAAKATRQNTMPSAWSWEPVTEGEFYAEFVAFVYIGPATFLDLVRRERYYIECADRAGRQAYAYGAQAAGARWELERAEKHKKLTRRRALRLARGRRETQREVLQAAGPMVNACAAALPLVSNPVIAAQLRYAIRKSSDWFGVVPLDDPAWDIGDLEEAIP